MPTSESREAALREALRQAVDEIASYKCVFQGPDREQRIAEAVERRIAEAAALASGSRPRCGTCGGTRRVGGGTPPAEWAVDCPDCPAPAEATLREALKAAEPVIQFAFDHRRSWKLIDQSEFSVLLKAWDDAKRAALQAPAPKEGPQRV